MTKPAKLELADVLDSPEVTKLGRRLVVARAEMNNHFPLSPNWFRARKRYRTLVAVGRVELRELGVNV
jgi:hypothetical protein